MQSKEGWWGRLGKAKPRTDLGVARLGVARRGVARRGVTRRGVARRVVTRRVVARRVVARRGVARRVVARRGVARRGVARRGVARRVVTRRGVAGRGVARRHPPRLSLVQRLQYLLRAQRVWPGKSAGRGRIHALILSTRAGVRASRPSVDLAPGSESGELDWSPPGESALSSTVCASLMMSSSCGTRRNQAGERV
eukprot:scaffold84689_cov50-Phaeocystis_antarctica.AAC.1